jgi:hypothetical protein
MLLPFVEHCLQLLGLVLPLFLFAFTVIHVPRPESLVYQNMYHMPSCFLGQVSSSFLRGRIPAPPLILCPFL